KELDSLKQQVIESLSPFQAACYKPIHDGKDVLIRAKTSSTDEIMALALPIIEILLCSTSLPENKFFNTGAIIMTPTRNLAKQIVSEFETLTINTSLKCLCIHNYHDVKSLCNGFVGILVGTPGRILDFVSCSKLKLTKLKIICLVETGDMLNIGFSKPLETVIKHIEKQTQDHQMILFSPKISIWVKYIVKKYMKNQYVEVDFSKSLSEGPTEKIYKYNILEQIEKKILFPLIGAFITSNKNNLTLDQIIGKISYTNNSGRLIKNISPVINSGGKYLSWEDTIPDNTMTAV
ncbi:343_t:CDS:2, partial [Entrophospora sp. SA101]